jgi:trk system potassium uptake protein TrkA
MKKQVAVIGLGHFGVSVATTLQDLGHEVLVIDSDEKNLQNVATQLPHALQADATNEDVLKELGIKNFDVAIVAMGSDVENSVLTTILVKSLGVKYVIARANDRLHGRILERIGADIVVYPELEMGVRTAHRMMIREASDYMHVIDHYGIVKLVAPGYLVDKRLSDIGFGPGGRVKAAVLLIQRKKEVIVSPGPEEEIRAGDTLILAGEDDSIAKLLTEGHSEQAR